MSSAQSYTSDSPLHYRTVTGKEGLDYISSHGLTKKDFDLNFQPLGRSLLIYPLPNGEIVVLEARMRAEFPAIIFNTIAGFENCIASDFFPIPVENMSWLEAKALQVKNFLTQTDFYLNPLRASLGIEAPFKTIVECENAYNKTKYYIHSDKNTDYSKDEVGHCFAIAMVQFLISKENHLWYLRKTYDIYNPYYEIIIINQHEKVFFYKNVIDVFSSAMASKKDKPFKEFYRNITSTFP